MNTNPSGAGMQPQQNPGGQQNPGQGQPVQQQIQQHQQTMAGGGIIKQQFIPRGMGQQQWSNQMQMPSPQSFPSNQMQSAAVQEPPVRTIPLYNANLQPAPPVPPENIMSESDRQTQNTYEQWLSRQNDSLKNQQSYYETEVAKLRKLKKSLNTKQRQLKKTGGDLTEVDAKELAKVTAEQNIIQKQLENARKQSRQHNLVIQDYTTKQKAKQTAPPSPLMSPSPGSSQQMQNQPVQSPLGNPMMQPIQSPLQSPSPMLSQSPGPSSVNSLLQSPHASAMSPYNTMQQSPRNSMTPGHSGQPDENAFSPSGSGGMPIERLTSPSPRMTSPQHHRSTPIQMMGRMGPNTGQYMQQNQVQNNQFMQQNQGQNMGQNPQMVQQQHPRFVRPQMISNDSQIRMRLGQQQNFQQPGPGNSPLGSPMSPSSQQQQNHPGKFEYEILMINTDYYYICRSLNYSFGSKKKKFSIWD
jgi:histone-lysine N-methyltransferase MLL3